MFKRVILAFVALFTFATPTLINVSPVQAHGTGTHTARCNWSVYNSTGSSTYSNYSAASNCAYNLGRRIFGNCLWYTQVYGVPANGVSGSFSLSLVSLSGGLCGSSQNLYSGWGGYVYTH